MPGSARQEPEAVKVASTDKSRAEESQKLKASMSRLFEIYSDISETADRVIKKRCPYKDGKSRCTALFGCRNQFFTKDPSSPPICAGSDNIDYRSAWDT